MTHDRGLKKKKKSYRHLCIQSYLHSPPSARRYASRITLCQQFSFLFATSEVNYIVFWHKCSGMSDELNQLDSSSDGRKF